MILIFGGALLLAIALTLALALAIGHGTWIAPAAKRYGPFVLVAILGALLYGGAQQVRQFYVDYQDFKLIRAWAGPQVNRWIADQRARGNQPARQPAVPLPPQPQPQPQPTVEVGK